MNNDSKLCKIPNNLLKLLIKKIDFNTNNEKININYNILEEINTSS